MRPVHVEFLSQLTHAEVSILWGLHLYAKLKVKPCYSMLFHAMQCYAPPPLPGGNSLIWALRALAAGQGMVFWPRCTKTGIQFDLPLPYRVRTCEQFLSFLSLRPGACEKLG